MTRRSRLAAQLGKIDSKATAPTTFSNVLSTIFDGVDEFVDMGDAVPFQFERTDAFSLSLWAKTTNAVIAALISKKSSTSTNPGYYLRMRSSGKLQFFLTNSNGNEIDVRASSVVINDGNWHSIIMV